MIDALSRGCEIMQTALKYSESLKAESFSQTASHVNKQCRDARKEKEISHFCCFFFVPTRHRLAAAQTRNENIGEHPSSNRSHNRFSARSPLIVVFAATRAEEAGNAKRNAFKRNFFVFQFCFVFRTVQSRFLPPLGIKVSTKERKKIEKKFYTISQSSSCWIIEIESDLQVEKKLLEKK